MKRRITVLVSNDLEHDQRVAKVCSTLQKLGFEITLVGRLLPTSKPFTRDYPIKRFRLFFTKGALFYAALNTRLFFYLLFARTDVILANDLDTLLPAYLISKWRGKKLVYDSHEYFTEAEGLTGNAFAKKVWQRIEKFVFPKLKSVYTVNESIASIYRKQYHADVKVVRNVPPIQDFGPLPSRKELGLPSNKKIVLLQGAYIDPDRGAEEAVNAMRYIENAILVIIGSGRAMPQIRMLAEDPEIKNKIMIFEKMPFSRLVQFTRNSDIGLSLDKPLHLNYTFSLPNKLFDYIHAGIPIVVSDLPELRRIVTKYDIGIICPVVEPKEIANCIKNALESKQRDTWKKNIETAKAENNWQEEEKVLHGIYSHL